MEIASQIVIRIIEAQERIIGPIAAEQALSVSGMTVDWSAHRIEVSDAKIAIGKLVEKYQNLFGQTSVEVCKEAAGELLPKLPKDQLPEILA